MAATKSSAGKPKLTGEQKKAAKAAKRVQRKQTWSNLVQAFQLTRKNDKLLVPIMVGSLLVVMAVVWAIGSLALGQPIYFSLPLGFLLGLAVAMLLFSRRAQTSAYTQAEGQPGAAAYVLDNLRGDWRVKQAIAGNTHLDAVHRLLGRPGIVLVGEGAPHRVRSLVAQEKKRIARVAGDTPIYDVIVGRADDEVPLAKLNGYLLRLPRNLSAEQVSALDKRIAALGGGKMPLPQGPMPQGAKMRNVARTAPPPQLSVTTPGTARGASIGLPRRGLVPPATFRPRAAALVVDAVASGLIAALVLSFTPRDNSLPGAAGHLPGSWSLLPLALDYVVGVLLTGQTLGMYLLRIRMVAVDRPPPPTRVRPVQIVVRTILLFVFIPALIVDRDGRGLHDRISGTVVVRL